VTTGFIHGCHCCDGFVLWKEDREEYFCLECGNVQGRVFLPADKTTYSPEQCDFDDGVLLIGGEDRL